MKIKYKLVVNSSVSIISMLVMLLLLNLSSEALQKNMRLSQNIGKIEVDIIQLGGQQKSFKSDKNLDHVQRFEEKIIQLNSALNIVAEELNTMAIPLDEVNNLTRALEDYHQQFSHFVAAQKRIGLNANDALYGELTKAVTAAERRVGSRDYKALSILLQARKSEKDFLSSHEEKYIDEFRVIYKRLQEHVKFSDFPGAYKRAVKGVLEKYNSAFLAVTEEQKMMGLTSDLGLQKNMKNSEQELEKIFSC